MPSTAIANMKYYPASAVLHVVFLSGAEYEYKDVPAALYGAMERAKSKGRFLNLKIKGNYTFRKIK
jgi:hypothetical protein